MKSGSKSIVYLFIIIKEDKVIAVNFFGASKLRKINPDNGIIIIKKLK